ncbi:MAG: hypothetical protein EBQ48_06455, partial [Betaproteobacteria bacterium]|nr:hypothetical protein [Betaproteobacteria bacterium]
ESLSSALALVGRALAAAHKQEATSSADKLHSERLSDFAWVVLFRPENLICIAVLRVKVYRPAIEAVFRAKQKLCQPESVGSLRGPTW